MQREQIRDWLTRRDDNGVYEADPDIIFPRILTELGVHAKEYTRYWVEVAYQCTKLAVMDIASLRKDDPRWLDGKSLVISIHSGSDKARWHFDSYPEGQGLTEPARIAAAEHEKSAKAEKREPFKGGKGVHAASKGLEARRDHYPRVRRLLVAG